MIKRKNENAFIKRRIPHHFKEKHFWRNLLFSGFLLAAMITGVVFMRQMEAQKTVETDVAVSAGAGMQSALEEPETITADYIQLPDPFLLLVNKTVAIPDSYEMTPRQYGNIIVDNRIYESLSQMIDDAGQDGVVLWVASGYRSVEEQQALLDRAVKENEDAGCDAQAALEIALRTIQIPGHSEHHTGLAVDFNCVSRNFEHTAEYQWLKENAAEYGFVQRYPADKTEITKIDVESWHYRYVGKEHAREMQRLGLCLEEYCLLLKKQDAGV